MRAVLTKRLIPAIDTVGRGLAYVAMAMMTVMIAVMLYEVAARKLFSAPTLWANDITYMINGSLFLIGAAFTLRMNAHVRIDFLSTRLPLRAQHAVNLLFYLCIILPGLYMVGSAATSKAWKAFRTDEIEAMSAWEPLIWPFFSGIAIGLVGLFIQVIGESLRHGIGIADPAAVRPPSETEQI